jgi:hypothetical protein
VRAAEGYPYTELPDPGHELFSWLFNLLYALGETGYKNVIFGKMTDLRHGNI